MNTDTVSSREGRYNAVFHLVTAAEGAEKYYSLGDTIPSVSPSLHPSIPFTFSLSLLPLPPFLTLPPSYPLSTPPSIPLLLTNFPALLLLIFSGDYFLRTLFDFIYFFTTLYLLSFPCLLSFFGLSLMPYLLFFFFSYLSTCHSYSISDNNKARFESPEEARQVTLCNVQYSTV